MDKTITKNDIVDNIYKNKQGEIERKDILAVVDAFLDEIKSSLKNGDEIQLRRFGTFELRLRKGREGARNPRTGAKVNVKSHFVAAFKPGQELKEDLLKIETENKNN